MKRLFLLTLMIIATAPALASDAELREYGRVFAEAQLSQDYCPGVVFNPSFFKSGIGGKKMSQKTERKILVESITPRMYEIKNIVEHYGAEYWCITYKQEISKKYKAPLSPVLFDGQPREDDRFHEDG